MAVPVCKWVTGHELVVVTVASAVFGICESDQVLKCALFLCSSPDGVCERGVAAGHDICPGNRRCRCY